MDSSNPPALPSDAWLARAAEVCEKMAEAFTAQAQAATDLLVKAWQPLQKALADYWRVYIHPYLAEWRAIAAASRERRAELDEIESARRQYAAWYNARHRTRQISWRRLSAPQRDAAALAYLA